MSPPNLVIAGAPKCGTSSLFSWLADHPDVCGSKVKETFYLMDQGHPFSNPDANFHQHGLAGYQAYFEHCSGHYQVVLEATTHYIYQQTALEVLSGFEPQPHIVFVLRKPSERVYSSFQYGKNVTARIDEELRFSQFIDFILSHDARSIDRFTSRETSVQILMNEVKHGQYIDYLSIWLSRFDEEKITVLLLENIKRDCSSSIKKLSKKIGLAPNFYENYRFPHQNKTYLIKSQSTHRQASRIARLIPRGTVKRWLKKTYLFFQRNDTKLSEEDKNTLTALEAYYKPFNKKLASTLALDLSAWE